MISPIAKNPKNQDLLDRVFAYKGYCYKELISGKTSPFEYMKIDRIQSENIELLVNTPLIVKRLK